MMLPYTAEALESGKTKVTVGHQSMEFNCAKSRLDAGQVAYNSGLLIQDAMPFLTADEREFLMSGTTPEQWDAIFGKEK